MFGRSALKSSDEFNKPFTCADGQVKIATHVLVDWKE
jgi:hypothetical protein